MTDVSLMYGKLAKYYDSLYFDKDYARDVKIIRRSIARYKSSTGRELLDVGCGTGKHLEHFRDFHCTGVDVSDEMLRIAKKNASNARFVRGDMSHFHLLTKFDVILCLFSSIGYLKTSRQLRIAIRNFARHLKVGGIVIIEPWIQESKWRVGHVGIKTYNSETVKIVRMDIGSKKGKLSVSDYHFLIAHTREGIKYFRERQSMRFFDLKETVAIMKQSNINAKFLRKGLSGRGLLIGVKK
jgi:SAM-dependent methyltransferase